MIGNVVRSVTWRRVWPMSFFCPPRGLPDPSRRLFTHRPPQSIARRRLATVRAVQSEPALESLDPCLQRRIFSPQRPNQREQFVSGRLAFRSANLDSLIENRLGRREKSIANSHPGRLTWAVTIFFTLQSMAILTSRGVVAASGRSATRA